MYIQNVEKTNDGCVYWLEDQGVMVFGICFKQSQNCSTDDVVESIILGLDVLKQGIDELGDSLP